MKKTKILFLSILIITTYFYFPIKTMANDSVPTIYEAENAYKSATVDVRIKAEVPEEFSGTITVEYTGKENEGFTTVLNEEDEYTTVIALPRDLYTYKQHSIANGYDIKINKNFLLNDETINLNNTYLLPIIVAKEGEINDNETYVTAKIYASPQECDFTGEIELTYSGTNGNSFIVILNQDNNYTEELSILSDLYTVKDIKITEGYEINTLYSFNILDTKAEQKYQMAVKVYNENEAPTKEEKNFTMKEVIFQGIIPDHINFDGDIVVSYTGDTTYPFETTLYKNDNYTKIIEIPIDTYELNYATSYDDLKYTFSSKQTFTLGAESETQNIKVNILEDGKIIEEINKEIVSTEEVEVEPNKKGNPINLIIFAVIVVGFICYIIMHTVLSKNNKKSKSKKDNKDKDTYPLDEIFEELEELEDDTDEENLDDFL